MRMSSHNGYIFKRDLLCEQISKRYQILCTLRKKEMKHLNYDCILYYIKCNKCPQELQSSFPSKKKRYNNKKKHLKKESKVLY